VLNDDMDSRRTRWIAGLLGKHTRALVAIDDTVRRSIPAELSVRVIHNSFSPGGPFEADATLDERLAKLSPSSFKVGFVGNLLASKGIVELIEAMCMVRDAGVDAELVIAGDDAQSSRGVKARLLKPVKLSHDVRSEVESRIGQHGLADRVHLLGFTDNIGKVYQSMDVVCFPSHLDAPGRPIFEAAFYGVPSIAAIRNPTPDTFVHEGTGLTVKAGDVGDLAAAIMRLANDRSMVHHLGTSARALALENFDAAKNMEKLLALYRDVCPAKGSTS
jgi:glycosyltransferase involved in cell wall biosynthesis